MNQGNYNPNWNWKFIPKLYDDSVLAYAPLKPQTLHMHVEACNVQTEHCCLIIFVGDLYSCGSTCKTEH